MPEPVPFRPGDFVAGGVREDGEGELSRPGAAVAPIKPRGRDFPEVEPQGERLAVDRDDRFFPEGGRRPAPEDIPGGPLGLKIDEKYGQGNKTTPLSSSPFEKTGVFWTAAAARADFRKTPPLASVSAILAVRPGT